MGADENVDFARWYAEQHPRVLTALLLVTGDFDAAQEATDEAFVRAYTDWARVSKMRSRQGWTYQVALNFLRRRARRARLEQIVLARQAPRPNVPAPAGEAWEAVRRLPPRQRTAIVLRFVADLTEEQVGIAMGVSRSTISTSLADARRSLAAMLAEPGDAADLEIGCA